jgi:sensory rhodopsin
MCVEFYLILQKAGAKKSLMWNLIALSTFMLVTGYIGEAGLGDAVVWGTASGISYFFIVYILWFGSAGQLAQKAGGAVLDAFNALKWFVLVGWAIYPIGYMIGTDGWYDFVDALGWNMEVVYNVGDAINKIGFGLVIYNLAVTDK